GVFQGTNAHDLLFVAATETGFGYFKNFGETRRRGIELSASARAGRVVSGVSYSLTDATYQSDEVVNGSSNSSNREGTIAIHAGAAAAARGAGQQRVQRTLLFRGAAWPGGIYERWNVCGEAVAGGGRRVSDRAIDLLRTRRADHVLGRRPGDVLVPRP